MLRSRAAASDAIPTAGCRRRHPVSGVVTTELVHPHRGHDAELVERKHDPLPSVAGGGGAGARVAVGVSLVVVPSAVSPVPQADPMMLTKRITPIAELCARRVVRCRPRSISTWSKWPDPDRLIKFE